MRLRFVDVPCGAGLLSVAFKEAGFEQVLGVDIDPLRCRSYAANDIGEVLQADVEDVEQLPEHEVLIGGIPCQPFSILRYLIIARLGGMKPKRWVEIVVSKLRAEREREQSRKDAFADARQRHLSEVRERDRRYRQSPNGRVKRRASAKASYERHRESRIERAKDYYRRNRERILIKRREAYARQREEARVD